MKNYSSSALYKASISSSCQWVAELSDGTNKTINYTTDSINQPDDGLIFFGTRNKSNEEALFNYNKVGRNNFTLYFLCDKFPNVPCSIEVKFVNKLPGNLDFL